MGLSGIPLNPGTGGATVATIEVPSAPTVKHLQVLADSPLYVVRGNIPGHSTFEVLARNQDIDANDVEDIWEEGGTRVFLAAAEQLTIVSDNAADTAAGIGARTVSVVGLDADYDSIQEELPLDGTTPVITTQRYLRLTRVRVLTAGSSERNVGKITIDPVLSGSGSRQGGIAPFVAPIPPTNRTMLSHYTVPRGKTGFLHHFRASEISSGTGSKRLVLDLQFRLPGNLFEMFQSLTLEANGTSSVGFDRKYPLEIPEKTDLKVVGTSFTANTQCSLNYGIVLVDNSL